MNLNFPRNIVWSCTGIDKIKLRVSLHSYIKCFVIPIQAIKILHLLFSSEQWLPTKANTCGSGNYMWSSLVTWSLIHSRRSGVTTPSETFLKQENMENRHETLTSFKHYMISWYCMWFSYYLYFSCLDFVQSCSLFKFQRSDVPLLIGNTLRPHLDVSILQSFRAKLRSSSQYILYI